MNPLDPRYLSLHDLVFYGLQSDDEWIARLAGFADAVLSAYPRNEVPNCAEDVIAAEENRAEEIRGFDHTIRDLGDDLADQSREIDRLTIENKSLRHDLNDKLRDDHTTVQIKALKAEVFSLNMALDSKNKEINTMRRDLEGLREDHEYLTEKHNTFTILATE